MGRTAQFRRRIYWMIRAGDSQEFQENILILQNLLFRGLRMVGSEGIEPPTNSV
jgi:hypothetical protein